MYRRYSFHAYAILASFASMPTRFFSISLLCLTSYIARPQHKWQMGGSKDQLFLAYQYHAGVYNATDPTAKGKQRWYHFQYSKENKGM
jgi:hypothetical protein